MAEFCLDCWNELNGTSDPEYKYTYAEDLCEGCGEWKETIVIERRFQLFHKIVWTLKGGKKKKPSQKGKQSDKGK